MHVGEALRINARLVDVQSERVLWQGKFDSEITDLFPLCERLTQAIAGEVKASPLQPGHAARRSRSPAPEAHLAYLKGRYFWHKRTGEDLYRSVAPFQRALAIDPGYALAHTGLADAYILIGIWGLEPSHSAFGMARRSAERALELDDNSAEAHASMGEVLRDYDWDWSGAESEYRRAIALNPNYATAHHFYAALLVTLTRYSEAAEEIELARTVDPFSPSITAIVPLIYLAARDYTRARQEGQRAVELEPHSPIAHWMFGRACLFEGDLSRAVTELETASDLANKRSMWQAELSFARARAGDRSGALAVVTELTGLAQSKYVSPYDFAVCYAGLGDAATALNFLEDAYRERVMRTMAIGDPEFDSLHGEPRFVKLTRKLRLPPPGPSRDLRHAGLMK
jgi:tetratricopeptide (TPR) repeat protein